MTGRRRWWDGTAWKMYEPAAQQPAPAEYAGRKALTKRLLLGWMLLWVPAIYYSASPNHYWHA